MKRTLGNAAKKKITRAVKKAKKDTEKKVREKLAKAGKTKVARVLKSNRARINRLLKANNTRVEKKIRENNTRIADVLRGVKRKPKKRIPTAATPFDFRRFRGKRKKETFEQRLKRCADVHTVRDKILYGIADGSYKFKWSSIEKEAGYKTGERKKMLSVLDNKGYSVNQLAHRIWEENGGQYGRGPDDDAIRNEIIDVLQSVASRTDALNMLDRGQGDTPF